jgi:hypothetical protein
MSEKLLATMLMVVAAVRSPLSAQPIISPQQVWGADSDGVRMALSAANPAASPSGAEFDLAFQNIGSKDALLNLGIMVGGFQEPWAIRLILTDPNEKTREILYRSPRVGVIRGRADDFIVALPARGTYVLRIDLAGLSAYPKLKLRAGRYRLAALLEGKGPQFLNLDTPGIGGWPFWKGIAQSNSVDFDISE